MQLNSENRAIFVAETFVLFLPYKKQLHSADIQIHLDVISDSQVKLLCYIVVYFGALILLSKSTPRFRDIHHQTTNETANYVFLL